MGEFPMSTLNPVTNFFINLLDFSLVIGMATCYNTTAYLNALALDMRN